MSTDSTAKVAEESFAAEGDIARNAQKEETNIMFISSLYNYLSLTLQLFSDNFCPSLQFFY